MLAVAALGIFALNATGLQTKDQFTKTVDSVVGEQVIEDHGFPGGAGTPVVVMANADQADQVAGRGQGRPGHRRGRQARASATARPTSARR